MQIFLTHGISLLPFSFHSSSVFSNMNDIIGFYIHILGFTLLARNDDWRWASLQKDNIQIRFSKPNEHENFKGICFTGSFYFDVVDIDE